MSITKMRMCVLSDTPLSYSRNYPDEFLLVRKALISPFMNHETKSKELTV